MIILNEHPVLTPEILYRYADRELLKSEAENLLYSLQKYLLIRKADCPKIYSGGMFRVEPFAFIQAHTVWVYFCALGYIQVLRRAKVVTATEVRQLNKIPHSLWDYYTSSGNSSKTPYIHFGYFNPKGNETEPVEIGKCIELWEKHLCQMFKKNQTKEVSYLT